MNENTRTVKGRAKSRAKKENIPETAKTISIEEYQMLETVKEYSWYINNAMRAKVDELVKVIDQGKESMQHDDGNTVYRSMESMIEWCEQAVKEYRRAHEALEKAGVR